MCKKIFAVGLGFKVGDIVKYKKSFIETDANSAVVKDFLNILSNYGYSDKNIVISLQDSNYNKMLNDFKKASHNGSVDFINEAIELNIPSFICIMSSNEPPKNTEESFLILDLFSSGTLSSLNQEQRLPLTKVFAGLKTIGLTAAGLPGGNEVYDKFPSYLYFKDNGTNRFAPGSFVRYGAFIGSNNTLMMCVTVNFGVSIGDGNLIDGHSSIASCVQIGNDNKIGSFVSMEGVLSPVNADPVVVKNNNFFGTRCRIGTGLIIGNENFWGSGVDLSKGSPIKDLRKDSKTYGKYVKAGSKDGIQNANQTMITINNSYRIIENIQLYPGEYILTHNSEENRKRFERNGDLTENN